MISKRITERKDGKSSAADALRYGEGLKIDRQTGEISDKSHRTRLGNFGLVDDGVFVGRGTPEMENLIGLAAIEMQSNCDLNTRVGADKKIAHFVVSFNQERPTEMILRDTEDSMLAAMKLENNHFSSFLHNDNGYWHLHILASRIDKTDKHLGNPLWHDKINRDKVCREIEIRHGLDRDNGLHVIDAQGQIVEIPIDERRAKRDNKPVRLSDTARKIEAYSGEKTFQNWCNEIRIGDRLKHAQNWQDLHTAAAAYNCEVKTKGAGYIICPVGERGGIQLSKIGLKNLPAKFGAFQLAQAGYKFQPERYYTPEPNTQSKGLYASFKAARALFDPEKTRQLNTLREQHKQARAALRAASNDELAIVRASKKGGDKFAAVAVAKMAQADALTALAAHHAAERREMRVQLAEQGPGNTYRDYLVKHAAAGDENALILAQKYGEKEATSVSIQREADQLKIVASASGRENYPAPRLRIEHKILRNGTIVFNLGGGRIITDSRATRQIQLNNDAAHSQDSIETALRFATSKFGQNLTLTGPAAFQKLAVETAVQKGLGIRFVDPALDDYREKLETERRAPKYTRPRSSTNAKTITNFNKFDRFAPHPEPTRRTERLHALRGEYVASGRGLNPAELLPRDAPDHMEYSEADFDHGLRQRGDGKGSITSTATAFTPNSTAKPPPVVPPSLAERPDKAKKGLHIGSCALSDDSVFIIQTVGRDKADYASHRMSDFKHAEQEILRVAVVNKTIVKIRVDRAGKPTVIEREMGELVKKIGRNGR
jgi:hypothetical protein